MTRAERAHYAVWKPLQDAAIEVAGFASALHSAALQARLGRDPAGEEFCAIAARLPDQDRRRLSDCIGKLDTERARAGRSA